MKTKDIVGRENQKKLLEMKKKDSDGKILKIVTWRCTNKDS